MRKYCIKIKVWGMDWICFFPKGNDPQLISEAIADDVLASGDSEKMSKVFFDSREAAEKFMESMEIENEMKVIEKEKSN